MYEAYKENIIVILLLIITISVIGCSSIDKGELVQLKESEAEKLYDEKRRSN